MCLCCTRFPRTILSRANSIQQSTPHKASYLPHCASPALERLSHRKAAASPTPLLPRVGSRHKTPTVMCSNDHPVLFALEPAILHSVPPVLSLTLAPSNNSAPAVQESQRSIRAQGCIWGTQRPRARQPLDRQRVNSEPEARLPKKPFLHIIQRN